MLSKKCHFALSCLLALFMRAFCCRECGEHTAHWHLWGLCQVPEHALRSTVKFCSTNITFFTTEVFLPLKFKGIICFLCNIAQAVNSLALFSLSHEESGNHHCSNSVALEGKDKSVTILLEASATGQVFFSKCFHQLVVESSSPLHLCAFCWGSKPGSPLGGWSRENWSV